MLHRAILLLVLLLALGADAATLRPSRFPTRQPSKAAGAGGAYALFVQFDKSDKNTFDAEMAFLKDALDYLNPAVNNLQLYLQGFNCPNHQTFSGTRTRHLTLPGNLAGQELALNRLSNLEAKTTVACPSFGLAEMAVKMRNQPRSTTIVYLHISAKGVHKDDEDPYANALQDLPSRVKKCMALATRDGDKAVHKAQGKFDTSCVASTDDFDFSKLI